MDSIKVQFSEAMIFSGVTYISVDEELLQEQKWLKTLITKAHPSTHDNS